MAPKNKVADLEHPVPSDFESERMILGALMLGAPIEDVSAVLDAPAFFTEVNRRLFSCMVTLHEAGTPVDRLTLAGQLQKEGWLESCGGLSALVDLDRDIPPVKNLAHWVAIVKEKSNLRILIAAAQRTIDAASVGLAPAQEIANSAAEALQGIQAVRTDDLGKTPTQIVEGFPGGIGAFLNPSERKRGLPTGLVKVDDMTDGLHAGELVIIGARPGVGKAQPLDSLLKTPTGWMTMADAKVGDNLQSPDGRPSEITAIHPRGVMQTYMVKFSDGREIECSGDHLWEARSYRWWGDPTRVLSTDELADKLTAKRYRRRISIPLTSGNGGSNRELPLDPYVLGLLIGDGSMTSNTPSITTIDQEILDEIENRIPGVRISGHGLGKPGYRLAFYERGCHGYGGNPITNILKSLGLHDKRSHDKFIPFDYLNADLESRMELIRGLMDTDGTVGKNGGATTYTTTSQRLADDFRQLIWSVGGLCSKRDRITRCTVRGRDTAGKRSYTLTISMRHPSSLFRLKRKREIASDDRTNGNLPVLTVLSVEPCRRVEVQCISVSHHCGLYITNDYVVTHNSSLALNICEHLALNPRLQKAPVMFSLEMNAPSILTRLLCSVARVDQQKFRMNYIGAQERGALQTSLFSITESRLRLIDKFGITIPEISRITKRLVKDGLCDLMVLDYLQLCAPTKKGENRNLDISDMTRQLKILAGDCQIPIIALSQLSRRSEQRPGGQSRPQLSDLRESGSIEQDADSVWFIYRDEIAHPGKEENKGLAEILISKQRNGPIGKADVRFVGGFTRFENKAEDISEERYSTPSAEPPPYAPTQDSW